MHAVVCQIQLLTLGVNDGMSSIFLSSKFRPQEAFESMTPLEVDGDLEQFEEYSKSRS